MAFRAVSYDGRPIYVYTNNGSTLVSSFRPPAHDHEVYDDPIFLSTNKTLAKRWRLVDAVTFSDQTLPVEYGRVEYIMMKSQAGDDYAYGLHDGGGFYLEAFENGVPTQRRLTTVLMHKGKTVFVADNRNPYPRSGDV